MCHQTEQTIKPVSSDMTEDLSSFSCVLKWEELIGGIIRKKKKKINSCDKVSDSDKNMKPLDIKTEKKLFFSNATGKKI